MNTSMNNPTQLVIFGATGDLTARKLAPALFHLFEQGRLPGMFRVAGFARRDLSDGAFRQSIADAVARHLDKGRRPPAAFLDLFTYRQGVFENPDDYAGLAQTLAAVDEEWKTAAKGGGPRAGPDVCGNKLFYLAVPPEYYETIFTQLADSGLTKPCSPEEGWTRVLVEKPFGKNFQTARRLDGLLSELFKEEQVYRIDHYLAKEVLQNIVLFRFANNLLEDVWNNKFIEKIEIELLETVGIEDRGAFYDGLGALLDVGQNHLLQMLALTTMENPVTVSPETIRDRRRRVLESLRPPDPEEIEADTVRGQYRGYRQESGVAEDSTTETYFRIKAELDSPRWRGVPIFLASGKKMPRSRKEVVVVFRHPAPCLCPPGRHFRNSVHFRLEPEPGITIRFWSKKPGTKMELEEQVLDFKYHEKAVPHAWLEEYTTLLTDAIAGDQTLFISSGETMAGWRFIDPIVSAWRAEAVPLHDYSPDEGATALGWKVEEPAAEEPVLKEQIGIVGLGKMGANLAESLLAQDWLVAGFNITPGATRALEAEGLLGAYSLKELAGRLEPPRVVWLMVPAGPPVDEVIFGADGLVSVLSKGDIIIDGGNSFYKDSIRRAAELEKYGLKLVDIGVSGGPSGARYGACLMVGGDRPTYEYLLPLFIALAVPEGVQFFTGAGAGHFVKMVHNGIEYGMMQAIAEGFTILKESDYQVDLTAAAGVYDHGSVIESRLMGWLADAFKTYGQELKDVSGAVGHTGEAEWTVAAGKELGVEEKIIEESLEFRVETAEKPSYTGKILTALRNQFGGHGIGRQEAGGRRQEGPVGREAANGGRKDGEDNG